MHRVPTPWCPEPGDPLSRRTAGEPFVAGPAGREPDYSPPVWRAQVTVCWLPSANLMVTLSPPAWPGWVV